MFKDLCADDSAAIDAGAYRFRDHRIDAIRINLDKVYGSNNVHFDPLHGAKRIPTERVGREFGDIGYSRSQFAAPVKVHIERDFGETFIIGFISAQNAFQNGAGLQPADTGIVVPATQIVGGAGLAYQSVHLNSSRIRDWCSWWWGRVLPAPLVLQAQPFSPQLSSLWSAITHSLASMMQIDAVPALLKNNLIDYAMSVLIQLHPHNYSGLDAGSPALSRAQVEQAKRFLIEQAHLDITSQDIAAYMDCSMVSLHHGFLRFEGCSPRQMLYRQRLQLAHHELDRGHDAAQDELWIRHRGFANIDGFRHQYLQRFGHLPEHTAVQSSTSTPATRRHRALTRRLLSIARVQALTRHIRDSLSDKITLHDLSARAGVSRSELIAAFTHHLGVTPLQFIIGERMKLARHLLESSVQPLVMVAVEAGFYSQSHMSTTFKHEIGISPGQYRKQFRRAEST